MEFTPDNPTVIRCVQAMEMETKGEWQQAKASFLATYNQASNEFEKYLAAFFVARRQEDPSERLRWLETSLQHAKKTDSIAANSALPAIYENIAECHELLNDHGNAKKYHELAETTKTKPHDPGPFFHGTKADLKVGDELTAGRNSNYSEGLVMNHIYFTAMLNGAGLAAALAKGEGRERVYVVEPSGEFESDPNVTDKKFPGNPTRSYRTQQPLKIIGEIADWKKQTAEDVKRWRKKLENNKGEIIN